MLCLLLLYKLYIVYIMFSFCLSLYCVCIVYCNISSLIHITGLYYCDSMLCNFRV